VSRDSETSWRLLKETWGLVRENQGWFEIAVLALLLGMAGLMLVGMIRVLLGDSVSRIHAWIRGLGAASLLLGVMRLFVHEVAIRHEWIREIRREGWPYLRDPGLVISAHVVAAALLALLAGGLAWILGRLSALRARAVPVLLLTAGLSLTGCHSEGTEPEDPREIPDILRDLEDPDSSTRRRAIDALRWEDVPASVAVPALLRRLGDENAGVHERAIMTLARYGPDAAAAAPLLVEDLRSGTRALRRAATWTLGEIGRPARGPSLSLLREAAHGEDPILAVMASRALDKFRCQLPRGIGHARPEDDQEEGLTVVVRVDEDGIPRIGEERLETLRDVLVRLREHARAFARYEPYDDGAPIALLEIDHELPWAVADALLAVCAHPEVRIRRVHVVVGRAYGDWERRLTMKPFVGLWAERPLRPEWTVRIGPDLPPVDLSRLEAKLLHRLHGRYATTARLRISPDVAYGAAVTFIDALLGGMVRDLRPEVRAVGLDESFSRIVGRSRVGNPAPVGLLLNGRSVR